MNNTEVFSEFKEVLERTDFSQAWAARRLDVTSSYLNRVLAGQVKAGDDLLKKIIELKERTLEFKDKLRASGLLAS